MNEKQECTCLRGTMPVLRKNSILSSNFFPAAKPSAPTLNLYRSWSDRNRP
jgi:hypothetical protein